MCFSSRTQDSKRRMKATEDVVFEFGNLI